MLAKQLRGALGKLEGLQKTAEILLAYEPVWAIGEKGIPPTADYANARHAEIAKVAEDVLGYHIPCLYGGSVNPAAAPLPARAARRLCRLQRGTRGRDRWFGDSATTRSHVPEGS